MSKEEFLVVLNKDEDSISFVDIKLRKVIKTIASDHNPHEVAITPDGKKTYVSCSLGNSLMVIDNATFEVIHRIHDEDFNFPHGLAIDQKGTLYLASTYSSMVYAIDTERDVIVNKMPTLEAHSHMVSLTPDEKHIYVPNIGSQSLTLIETAGFEILETIAVGNGPEGVAVHPDGQTVYVANQHDNTLFVMDAQTHDISFKRKIGACPIRIVFTSDGKYALIPNRESNDLSIIQTQQVIQNQVRPWEIKRIPVGVWPGGTVVNHDDTTAYVANNKTNDISIIDLVMLKEVGRIDVGIHPDGLAYLVR